jgi:choline monooxygenase
MTLEGRVCGVSKLDRALTERALRIVLDKTTDMAPDVLRVPLHYYSDPKLTEIEEASVLRCTPLAVVPSSQIPNNHDFLVRSVLGDSLLVTRDGHGRAHVFLNYCRHRGAKPACGSGNSRTFVCPYHAWNYDSAGALVRVPGQAGFNTIDTSQYGLVELPNDEKYGFVWAVLSANLPIDVDAHLGDLAGELASWHYEDYGYHDEREFESEVSWKGALEAFAEGYHFPFVHGKSVIGQNTVANTHIYDEFGRHHRIGFPYNWIHELAENPDSSWDPKDRMGLIYWIYPNLILANSQVGVEIIDMLPANSPTRCTVRHSWMARYPATDDDMRAFYDDVYNQVHAAVRDEDFVMLPQCGEAVRHAQHDHMIIGRNEIAVQHMIRVFAGELGVGLE